VRSSSSVVVAVVLVRASRNSEAEGAFDLDAIPIERFGARFTTATSAQPERRGSFVSTGESQAPWIRELAMMGSLGYGRDRRVLGGACGVFGMHDHRQGTVENAFFRFKSILGDRLRARTSGARGTEALIACSVLNRMFELGRPASVAIPS
jgi:hypothetical protein